MDKICDGTKCTGCGLCTAVCPQKAIKLSIVGIHYFPIIDQMKCVNCGICKKKCITNSPVLLHEARKCYAAWSLNQIQHYECASGGVATVLSEKFIEQGGYVVGCTWNADMQAVALVTNNKEDLVRFSKSKYVHNYFSSDVYSRIKQLLRDGKKVLFVGVPCQCAALQTYCDKNNANLYVVNLLCHGGASPKLFENYLKSFSFKKEQVADVTFRGGKYDCNLCVWSENKKLLYVGPQYEDPYFYSFMQHTIYRKSCLACKYVGTSRPADLTLADFWGLDSNFVDEHKLKQGVNLLITHSDKGEYLLSSVEDRILYYERQLNEAVDGNETLRSTTPKPATYDILNWAFPRFSSLKFCLLIFDSNYLKHQLKRWLKDLAKKIIPDSIIEYLK